MRLSTREIDRLFDYIDKHDLDDGALKIAFVLTFFNRNFQEPDNEPVSKRTTSESVPRNRESQELPDNDAASIVFRKQPHLLEELIKMALSVKKQGRLKCCISISYSILGN